MSTHNIGFYEELTKKYLLIFIKYHKIRTLSVILFIASLLNEIYSSKVKMRKIIIHLNTPSLYSQCSKIMLYETTKSQF